jgi:hypothetical protein
MRREYQQFFRLFGRTGVVATPEHDDWLRAGGLLARYAARWGALEPAKHVNDILILLTARRLGAELMSENLHDMLSWARMLDSHDRRIPIYSISQHPR